MITTEEFAKNVKHVHPDIEIIGEYKGLNKKILIKNKYGVLNCFASTLLKDINPTIQSATNKTEYFKNQLKEECFELYNNIELISEYIGMRNNILIKNKYGICKTTPLNLLSGRAPTIKSAINKTEYFINKAKEVHGDRYDYSLVEYKSSYTKVKIICKNHGIFEQTPNRHISTSIGCRKCGWEFLSLYKRQSLDEFIWKASNIHNNKYDYSKVEYINSNTKVCVICPEHGEFWQLPTNHAKGVGCPKCNKGLLTDSLQDFISKAKKIHGDKYDYSLVEYAGINSKICIVCPIHGEFWQRAGGHTSGSGCPKCNSSKGELKIEKWLKENNVEYINQKTFSGCANIYPLRFDFYLPKYNLCIEYDGKQHFEPIDYFGGQEALKYTQYNDEIKNNYCKQNNINLLRIPYWDSDNVSKIIKKSINNIKNTK